MKYTVKFTTRFKKDMKLAQKQGRNLDELFNVVERLANGERLEAKYRDHQLNNMGGVCDCHIQSDWVLLYEYIDDVLVLLLHRIGSHSQLAL